MKKPTCLIFSLLLITLTLSAQQSDKKSSVLLGESLSGDVTSFKPFLAGYTASFNVLLWADKRFSFETGLDYSVRTNKPGAVDYSHIITFDQYPYTQETPYYMEYGVSSHYISIPVKAMINYGSGKLKFFSGLGFSIDCHYKDVEHFKLFYKTSTGGTYTNEGTVINYINRENRFDYYSGIVFTGASYDFAANWQLRSTVTFRNRVSNAFFYDPDGGNLTTLGLGVGLYYKL